MKVGQLLLVVVLKVGVFSANAWDVGVAVGGQIQFLNSSGAEVGFLSEGLVEVGALAYNSELRRLYFSDNENSDGSIFSLNLPEKMTNKNQTAAIHTVVSKQVHQVKGVAYDDMTGILYWSNGAGHAILWVKVSAIDQPQAGQPLLRVDNQIPMGLAIDNCKRYLYWSNCGQKPSLERSLLDGSGRQTLVSEDLVLPYAVVVDQNADRLYWVDERPGAEYRIESSDLNGKDRRVLIGGSDHQPFALAVSAGSVFWADHIHLSVWRLPLDSPHSSSTPHPLRVASYRNSPKALVSASSGVWTSDLCSPVIQPVMKVIPATVTKTVSELPDILDRVNSSQPVVCFNKGIWQGTRGHCDCLPGYSGSLCQEDQCRNHCVRGKCHASARGLDCLCEEGYTGTRCEVSVCHNYCVTGNCTIDVTGQPQCHCREGYAGKRCDVNFTQQQELKDNMQEVCKAFCALWTQSSKDNIQPFEACRCQEYEQMSPLQSQWRSDYVLVALLALCSLLMVLVAVLTKKVFVLRKRPRIKKRIIVNKSVTPLTCRPSPAGGEQCEITIENCCNMNICETPCFEPDFRQPSATLTKSNKGAKEEKKTLLGNMELPPDDLY